jgi:hypothetical protein
MKCPGLNLKYKPSERTREKMEDFSEVSLHFVRSINSQWPLQPCCLPISQNDPGYVQISEKMGYIQMIHILRK